MWHWSCAVQVTGVPALQAPAPSQVSAPLQALPSVHDVPDVAGAWVQVPLALQVSTVHGLLSLQDCAVHVTALAKPSWNTICVPEPAMSTSRPMKAPVAIAPVPNTSVPLGTSTSAFTWLPVPNDAAGGVAVSAPLVPLIPDTSIRIPLAVRVTPDAGPMMAPLVVLTRPAT
ncbi:MAG TPA: hypothetical protein VN962_19335 [Polyangia bacterium]|nr:hypothetical protein [Polyangia bacterium]